jgi:TRAP-type C4-dicarboxylate transport system permease small subunit
MKQGIHATFKAFNTVASFVEKLGSFVLLAMVLLTVTDITLRRFFNSPLPYSYEVTEFLLVVVAYCYIAFTTSDSRHVSVDTLTARISGTARRRLRIGGDILTIGLFGMIAWQNVLQANHVLKLGTTSAILHIPKFPFQYWVAIGAALACLVLLLRLINYLVGESPDG